ncbi:TPA: hypothetical protein DCX15_02890 [bacterium]|nr:hypothetical protein [bacterium]
MPAPLIKEEERHILNVLPILLKRNDRFRREVSIILSETLATKDELSRVLEEIRQNREETSQQFREMREETNRRFEEMREETSQQFREMREETNRRFEEMREETNRRFEEMHKEFISLGERVDDRANRMELMVGRFTTRAGRNLENAIAGTLRISLGRRDIKPEDIILRKRLIDQEGMIGPKGRKYELDLCVIDSENLLFEVKSYAEPEDVERFNDKAELAIAKLKLVNPTKIFITLDKDPEIAKLCDRRKILLA